jgi:hypothetical protein
VKSGFAIPHGSMSDYARAFMSIRQIARGDERAAGKTIRM